MTKICYIDAALYNENGHYANTCRHITGELRRRGFSVDIYGNRRLLPKLAEELSAIPFVRHHPDDNIISQPRLSYRLALASFLSDLREIWGRDNYDLVLVNWTFPPQFMAVAIWLDSFAAQTAPRVAIELPGGRGHYTDCRYVEACNLLATDKQFPLLWTFGHQLTAEYVRLINKPVETLPHVQIGVGTARRRKRTQDGAVTVAFLGSQRQERGYDLIPEIIASLKCKSLSVKFLVHNSDKIHPSMTNEKLRALSEADDSIVFEHKTGDQVYWQSLLDRSDLIVLPYNPNIYNVEVSSVAIEAVSEGIPLVVPCGTTTEVLIRKYQGGRTVFEKWEVHSIANAIEIAINDFDTIAARAEVGAVQWRHENGAAPYVNRLLELVDFQELVSDRQLNTPYIGWPPLQINRIKGLVLDAIFGIARALRPVWSRLRKKVG